MLKSIYYITVIDLFISRGIDRHGLDNMCDPVSNTQDKVLSDIPCIIANINIFADSYTMEVCSLQSYKQVLRVFCNLIVT